ncbi:unnamed protein product [Sphagnum balticum]
MKCSTTSAATWFFLSTNNPEKKKKKKKKKQQQQQQQQQRRDRNKSVHCDRCCASSSLYNPTGLQDLFSIRAHGFARDDVDAQDCRSRARSDALKSSARALRERERESKQAGGQEGLGRPGQEKRAEEEIRT